MSTQTMIYSYLQWKKKFKLATSQKWYKISKDDFKKYIIYVRAFIWGSHQQKIYTREN